MSIAKHEHSKHEHSKHEHNKHEHSKHEHDKHVPQPRRRRRWCGQASSVGVVMVLRLDDDLQLEFKYF
jgi:hypothetical protein